MEFPQKFKPVTHWLSLPHEGKIQIAKRLFTVFIPTSVGLTRLDSDARSPASWSPWTWICYEKCRLEKVNPKNILVQHGDFHPMGSQSEIKTPENGHFNSTNFRDFQTLPNCWWDLNCLEKCVLVRCVGANLPQGSGKTKECFMFQTTTWLLLCKLYIA